MKLIRFGPPGPESPGVELEDGTRFDVSGVVPDFDEAFFGGGGLIELRRWLSSRPARVDVICGGVGIKPGPCYLNPGDIVELGIDRIGTQRQCIVAYLEPA